MTELHCNTHHSIILSGNNFAKRNLGNSITARNRYESLHSLLITKVPKFLFSESIAPLFNALTEVTLTSHQGGIDTSPILHDKLNKLNRHDRLPRQTIHNSPLSVGKMSFVFPSDVSGFNMLRGMIPLDVLMKKLSSTVSVNKKFDFKMSDRTTLYHSSILTCFIVT